MDKDKAIAKTLEANEGNYIFKVYCSAMKRELKARIRKAVRKAISPFCDTDEEADRISRDAARHVMKWGWVLSDKRIAERIAYDLAFYAGEIGQEEEEEEEKEEHDGDYEIDDWEGCED